MLLVLHVLDVMHMSVCLMSVCLSFASIHHSHATVYNVKVCIRQNLGCSQSLGCAGVDQENDDMMTFIHLADRQMKK